MFNPPTATSVDFEHVFVDSRSMPVSALPNCLYTVEFWEGVTAGVSNVIRWFERIGDLPYDVRLRVCHEFNGAWYPWTKPADVRSAFRTLEAGKPANVQLVWCPNVIYQGSADLEPYWPGDDLVQYIGMDGYNTLAGHAYWPHEVFEATRVRLALRGKPIMICETASPRGLRGMPQADWARMLIDYGDATGMESVCWFNQDKERPWQLGKKALKAYLS